MHKFNNLDLSDINVRNSRIRYMAIKAIYPNVITRRGDLVYDKDENLISTDEALVKTEYDKLLAEYDALDYARKREAAYPLLKEFAEAYTEKEFGGDSTKMDAYKIKYEKVRSDNPK